MKPGIGWRLWAQELGLSCFVLLVWESVGILVTFLLAIPLVLFNFCWLQDIQESHPDTGNFTSKCLSVEDKHQSFFSLLAVAQGREQSTALPWPSSAAAPPFWVGSDYQSDILTHCTFQVSHSRALPSWYSQLKSWHLLPFSFMLSVELVADYLTFIWQRIKAAVHAFRELFWKQNGRWGVGDPLLFALLITKN